MPTFLEFLPAPHPSHPVQQLQNRQSQLTSCLDGQWPTCALRPSLPSSWFHCSSGHRFGTFTPSNPASGPEFFCTLNPVHPETRLNQFWAYLTALLTVAVRSEFRLASVRAQFTNRNRNTPRWSGSDCQSRVNKCWVFLNFQLQGLLKTSETCR